MTSRRMDPSRNVPVPHRGARAGTARRRERSQPRNALNSICNRCAGDQWQSVTTASTVAGKDNLRDDVCDSRGGIDSGAGRTLQSACGGGRKRVSGIYDEPASAPRDAVARPAQARCRDSDALPVGSGIGRSPGMCWRVAGRVHRHGQFTRMIIASRRKNATAWESRRVAFEVSLLEGSHSWSVVALFGPHENGDFDHATTVSFTVR